MVAVIEDLNKEGGGEHMSRDKRQRIKSSSCIIDEACGRSEG